MGAAALGVFIATPGASGDLVYTPTNPSFGGSGLNSGHLLAIANAQRNATARDVVVETDDEPTVVEADEEPTDARAELFLNQLQGRLFSALSAQVTEAIFGENQQNAGTVTFGDTEVSFERTSEAIRLVINDFAANTQTEIVVPQLVIN
ncbi:curli assembly protein CsgF [Profundibacterium mesophilum]|uniref:curli assembly protein CsgF n=1 Tax=Profundibacterium mesophilum TaxID=1258573 RepID=UPI00191673CA|nr:curli assembly protein CsgF [Profundibacterium mesophilum]